MDDILTITLKRPVTLDGADPITEITLVEPTYGQFEAAMKEPNNTSANTVLIAASAKIAPAAVRLMVISDVNKAIKFLEGFTRDAETPSG